MHNIVQGASEMKTIISWGTTYTKIMIKSDEIFDHDFVILHLIYLRKGNVMMNNKKYHHL